MTLAPGRRHMRSGRRTIRQPNTFNKSTRLSQIIHISHWSVREVRHVRRPPRSRHSAPPPVHRGAYPITVRRPARRLTGAGSSPGRRSVAARGMKLPLAAPDINAFLPPAHYGQTGATLDTIELKGLRCSAASASGLAVLHADLGRQGARRGHRRALACSATPRRCASYCPQATVFGVTVGTISGLLSLQHLAGPARGIRAGHPLPASLALGGQGASTMVNRKLSIPTLRTRRCHPESAHQQAERTAGHGIRYKAVLYDDEKPVVPLEAGQTDVSSSDQSQLAQRLSWPG